MTSSLIFLAWLATAPSIVGAFAPSSTSNAVVPSRQSFMLEFRSKNAAAPIRFLQLQMVASSTTKDIIVDDSDNDDEIDEELIIENDDDLLDTVSQTQFEELCVHLDLPTDGTKMELLLRLRAHATEQAALETKRLRENLKARVEVGVNDDERERHEILGTNNYRTADEDDLDDDEEGFFYYELPTKETTKESPITTTATTTDDDTADKPLLQKPKEKVQPKVKNGGYLSQADVLAPPPPPADSATVDEDGNRVVTVYSTTDHNDLTGVAAAQPGQAALSSTDPMSAGSSLGTVTQPWDIEDAAESKSATTKELEDAKDKVTELVRMLLAMSGAPAFRDFDLPDELDFSMDDDNDDIDLGDDNKDGTTDTYTSSAVPGYNSPNNYMNGKKLFVGFDPSKVPTNILTEASQSLRANRGQVLQEVLRDFDVHACGQDGMAGDDAENGGGHFREVSKVRAFLEGYRRAQVRKAARVTVTFLLDKLVTEGVDGLDLSLSTMSRSNDDSSNENDVYELNDSLINYLNDIIREQEKKVDQLVGIGGSSGSGSGSSSSSSTQLMTIPTANGDEDLDPVSLLWNQTRGEDGGMIESIDPKDPKTQRVLQEEYEKSEMQEDLLAAVNVKKAIPESAPEKMLLLLTLLRERIKTEAAFGGDERSRNLRVLAYCLQCNSPADREELVVKDIGGAIDRLDSFMELVSSSIEYAESTSYQLKPASGMPLNVKLLKSILDMVENIRETQAWQAAGLKS